MKRDDIYKLYKEGPDAVVEFIQKQNEIIETLINRVKELEERFNKNSSNSNKPPSSDGLSRKDRRAQERKSRKKRGGQHGHEGKQLKMVATPDCRKVHKVKRCSGCNGSLVGVKAKGHRRRQVFDIPEVSVAPTHRLKPVASYPG